MPKPLVVIVIAGNAAWTLASIALLFSGAVTPNLLGEAFCRDPGDCGRRLWPSCNISACAGAAARWRLEPNSNIVIARSKATKQSKLAVILDCFAEPVIGRAIARDPSARIDGLRAPVP